MLIVSTPYLLQWDTNCTYPPNPVDIDHFKPHTVNETKKSHCHGLMTKAPDLQVPPFPPLALPYYNTYWSSDTLLIFWNTSSTKNT
ncbi:MAG TPA: hypothetical protein VEL70_05040 [Candidatus Acidoferrum sp.]|nr:hypothetical protein [Candidatus Acidoferrum sp.]